jgi:type VI secretion system secreted protein VgrG
VSGTTYTSVNGNAAGAQTAENDALAAYNTLTGQPVTQSLTGATLGSGGTILTLTPGVYFFSSSAQLTGQLVLSGSGNYIFLIGSTLTTASGSSIVLANGAQAGNVFWQVGSSATIGTDTSLDGSILAETSITLGTGADLDGRALALNGAVTLDDNTIDPPLAAVPEPSTLFAGALMLLPFGAGGLWTLRKKQIA